MKNFIEVGKTHDEQEQQIKQWIKDNGMQIIAGVVLGLGGIWGMGAYQQYQDEQAANARTLYLSIANSPLNAQVFDQLSNEHTDSGYLEQAGFILAKAAVNNKDYNTSFLPITDRMKRIQNITDGKFLSENEITKFLLNTQGIKK